ncbi:hypothetical protein IGI37_003826 [Enterococcus sp. AZ194]|uniref:GNAT family N-acetyltransferase n=1 Tax=Enterococcus sp. AZ194 TaxID=2774629 RepID=UPI003F2604AC
MRKNNFGQPIGVKVEQTEFQPLDSQRLEGQYCQLSRLREEQLPLLYQQLFEKGLKEYDYTYLPFAPFVSLSDFLAYAKENWLTNDPYFFCIWSKDGSEIVGLISLMRNDTKNGVIEVGYVVFSSKLKRTVAATEVQYLLARYAFEQLRYRRYEWKCDSLNTPSKEAALRLGFTYEGTFRNALVYKGRNRDTAWFSITESEWPQINERLTRWLAADNFDAEGKQKHSLKEM